MSEPKPEALQRIEQLPPPTPIELINRAVQSGAQVEVMEKLMGLQERWERNEARKAFDTAVAKAKSEIPIIRKGNLVDFSSAKGRTTYRYEDLASIAQIIDPILSKHGLSYRWRPNSDAKSVTVTCILSHAAGHMEENTLYAPHDLSGNKNAIQAVGSAVTYLQRYTLKAALGLAASADDDARVAGGPPSVTVTEPALRKQPPPPEKMPTEAQTFPVCTVTAVKEVHSKPGAPKKWTAFFIMFNDGVGDMEAATFDSKIAAFARSVLETHDSVKLTAKPGRKPGSREIISLDYSDPPPTAAAEDDVPMEFSDKGEPIQETIP